MNEPARTRDADGARDTLARLDADEPVRPRAAATSAARRVRALAWAVVLPAALTAAVAAGVGWHRERAAFERTMQSRARALAVDVDRALGTLEGVGWALGGSDALVEPDLSAFHRYASGASHAVGAWVVVVEHPPGASSRQLLNTRVPVGTLLPGGRGLGQFQGWKDRSVVVSDLFVGPVGGGWTAAVTVPAPRMRAGSRLSVSVATGPERFQELVVTQRFPDAWAAGVLDRSGRIVARVPDPAGRVGQLATAEVRARVAAGEEGAFAVTTVEGRRSTAYFGRSPTYGWWFVIAVPETHRHATIARAVLPPVGVALLAVLVALVALRRVERRLADGIAALDEASRGLEDDAPVRWTDTGLADVDRVGRRIGQASQGRERPPG